MKKNIFFTVLAVSAAIVSCSKDTTINSAEFADSNVIGFKTYVPKSLSTRGSAIGSATDLQATDFDVFAFTGSNQFMGASASDGVKIVYTTKWDYDAASEKAYWPGDNTTKINFFAVSPETNAGLTKNFTASSQKLDYEASATAAEQCDLMYASVKNVSKSDRDGDNSNRSTGGVKLAFKHALSQIVFKAKVAVADYSVDVESVTLCNLITKGSFTYSSETWTNDEATVSNYDADITAPVKGITTSAKDLTTSANALLLIPHTSTKWSVADSKSSIEEANTAKQTYIKISCKIANTKNGLSYIIGDADNYADVYIPFQANWTKGNKYTYTIVFCDPNGNNGYDPEGNPNNDDLLITFEPSVTPWTDQTEDIIM